MDIVCGEGYHYVMPIPPYPQLCDFIIKALQASGGTLPTAELEQTVADMLKLSPAERNEIHDGTKTKLRYRIQWARFLLKRKGLLESSKRGTVVLNKKGKAVKV